MSKKLFLFGIILILLSPFIADLVMETIYMHEPNFLTQRFESIVQATQLSGGLFSLAGIVMYVCGCLKKIMSKQ